MQKPSTTRLLALIIPATLGLSLAFFSACSPAGSSDQNGDPSRSGDGAGNNIGAAFNPDGTLNVANNGGADNPLKLEGPTPNCGDGILDDDEACDHGFADTTQAPTEGCFQNCRGVDSGWLCTTPGEPCSRFAVCGDGVVAFPEQCDDGDPLRVGGDGCSENCKLEIGYKCEGTPSVCSETTCGDDIVEGAEMCEPSLDEGCTAECQFAPQCGNNGPCTSTCGDGLKLGEGEDCDDGNNLPGDGCSPDCKIEPGYSCAATSGECQTDASGTCIQRVPVVFRDFDYNHPNFGGVGKDQCDTAGISTGAVQSTLTGGKPVTTNSVACTDKLSEWYSDTDQSTRHNDTLILYQNDAGNYVNRWGANGEQFTHPTNNYVITQGWCGNGSECSECTLAADEKCFSPCPQGGGTCAGRDVAFDGNPFFFPVDGIDGAKDNGGEAAAVSDEDGLYGGNGPTETEAQLTGEGPKHNFSFTTEIAYWFAFEADDPATEVNEATNASFEFVGDDDVWVFVNGQLAVDLGGKHAAEKGEFTLDGNAPTFGMETGNVYEIKVFHAERQAIGSTFKLTLSGFNTSRSDCVAECGDGIIGFGEECDNGDANIEAGTAVYSGCNTECRLEGGFCGNGIVDTEAGEQCDDADPVTGGGCTNCRILIVR